MESRREELRAPGSCGIAWRGSAGGGKKWVPATPPPVAVAGMPNPAAIIAEEWAIPWAECSRSEVATASAEAVLLVVVVEEEGARFQEGGGAGSWGTRGTDGAT